VPKKLGGSRQLFLKKIDMMGVGALFLICLLTGIGSTIIGKMLQEECQPL
jgi:hypothetical protein